MSAVYPLETNFVQLERTESPAHPFTQLPTLLTFTDSWDWFTDERAEVRVAEATAPISPVMWFLAASIGLFGAALITLLASLALLVAVLVS
jgi:hypothetical protein